MRSLPFQGKNLVCKSQASRVGRKQKNRAGCRGRMCVAELMSDEKDRCWKRWRAALLLLDLSQKKNR